MRKQDYKKAQAGLEFLMTYGWAVLIVIACMGVLAWFGVLMPSRLLPERCIIDSPYGLSCEDYSADDLNDITLRINNFLDESVSISKIEIFTGMEGTGKLVCKNLDGGSIRGGSSETFVVGDECDLQAGDVIRGDIKVWYTRGNGIQRVASGNLIAYVNAAGGELVGPDEGVCENADEEDLCGGLDFVFGEGYEDACCNDFEPVCC